MRAGLAFEEALTQPEGEDKTPTPKSRSQPTRGLDPGAVKGRC